MPTLAEVLAAKKTKPASGIRITPESEKAALAAAYKASFDATAPKAQPLAPRELGAVDQGERIPMEHPEPDASPEDQAWFSACHSLDTSLGIVIEPGETSEHAWIACRPNPHKAPILICRLPLINRPSGQNPF
jgi:hypothetical protein